MPELARLVRFWRTLADECGNARSFSSFAAAKKALGARSGHELNHIVEQCQARTDRGGFAVERINSTDNLVFLPHEVHDLVSRKFSSKSVDGETVLRDMLNDEDWEVQHKRGSQEIDRAWERYDRR